MLITYPDLKAKGIPLSRFHLWRLERAGKFPRRVQVTEARVAWVEKEIDEWLASKIAARDGVRS